MKTHRLLTILITALVFAATGHCFALTPIQVLSKAEAKEMGMGFEAKAQGSDQVRVTLELKNDGKLKKFHRVELWIQDGQKVLYVGSLKDDEFSAKPGSAVVAFTLDRSLLVKAHLNVIVEDGEEKIGGLTRMNEFGYELKLDEHVPSELLTAADAGKL